jgi:ASCH domain
MTKRDATLVTPVGLAEIAELLDVREATAWQWHKRGILPPARWVVARKECWEKSEIVRWAESTGRLQPAMRALTIRQPWASLITQGLRDVENRTWRTNIRGRIAIHAAKPPPGAAHADLIREYNLSDMPTSAILGTVEIVDCVRDYPSKWAEPGTWQFVLRDARPLPVPILNVSGRLSFWPLSDDIAASLA